MASVSDLARLALRVAEARWVTIGAKAGKDTDGKKKGGVPVEIDGDGKIVKGPAHMTGKKPGELKREKAEKKPHQMTRAEFAAKGPTDKAKSILDIMHRNKVQSALDAGDDVPPHVLAEYPGIKKTEKPEGPTAKELGDMAKAEIDAHKAKSADDEAKAKQRDQDEYKANRQAAIDSGKDVDDGDAGQIKKTIRQNSKDIETAKASIKQHGPSPEAEKYIANLEKENQRLAGKLGNPAPEKKPDEPNKNEPAPPPKIADSDEIKPTNYSFSPDDKLHLTTPDGGKSEVSFRGMHNGKAVVVSDRGIQMAVDPSRLSHAPTAADPKEKEKQKAWLSDAAEHPGGPEAFWNENSDINKFTSLFGNSKQAFLDAAKGIKQPEQSAPTPAPAPEPQVKAEPAKPPEITSPEPAKEPKAESPPHRFIVVDPALSGKSKWKISGSMDDIQNHQGGYGTTYFDTKTGQYVAKGKKGPVKAKQPQGYPSSVANMAAAALDNSHHQKTWAEMKDWFADDHEGLSPAEIARSERYWKDIHSKNIASALALGVDVPKAVLADYPDIAKQYTKTEPPPPPAISSVPPESPRERKANRQAVQQANVLLRDHGDKILAHYAAKLGVEPKEVKRRLAKMKAELPPKEFLVAMWQGLGRAAAAPEVPPSPPAIAADAGAKDGVSPPPPVDSKPLPDGTRKSKDGTVWARAKAGGEVSPVNGKPYKGGRWMPIHGMSSPKVKKPAGDPLGGEMGTPSDKPKETPKPFTREPRPAPSPDEVAEKQQQKADWEKMKSGPMGQLQWLGDNPNQKALSATVIPVNKWQQFAQKVGEQKLKEIAQYFKNKLKEIDPRHFDGMDDVHKSNIDYGKTFLNRAHNKEAPTSSEAHYWLQTVLGLMPKSASGWRSINDDLEKILKGQP